MAAGLDCRLTACMLGLYYPKEAPAKDCLMSFSLIRRLLVIALAVLRCIPTLGSTSGDGIFHSHSEGKGSDKVHHHECLGREVFIPALFTWSLNQGFMAIRWQDIINRNVPGVG